MIIIEDLNIPISKNDIRSKQKINKDKVNLSRTINQLHEIAFHRLFHLQSRYTFFSCTLIWHTHYTGPILQKTYNSVL